MESNPGAYQQGSVLYYEFACSALGPPGARRATLAQVPVISRLIRQLRRAGLALLSPVCSPS